MAVRQINPRFCPCGSGLSRARCCELNLATLGGPEASRHLAPLEARAAEASRGGAPDIAERLALEVLEFAPGRTASLAVLYDIRKGQGRMAAAEALIRRIVALAPRDFWAVNELTLLLLGKGDIEGAERHARTAVRIAPDNAQSHYLIGMALTEAHRAAFAEFHYHRALALSGARDPFVLANFAVCLQQQGKMQAARALYEESLAAAPHSLHTLLGFARLEEAQGNLTAATALLDRAELLFPAHPSCTLRRAVLLGHMHNPPAALALLGAIEAGDTDIGAGEILEKGRLLDRMGHYEAAFTAFIEGKRRLRDVSGQRYLDVHAQRLSRQAKHFFTADRVRTLPRASVRADVAQPIFVLGFPRSGVSILEQLLVAHPRIAAGGELTAIADIADLAPRMLGSPLGYPEALADLWMADHYGDLDNLRDLYLGKARPPGIVTPGAPWFTDATRLNETDLGLISLLFPQSPVLHMVRHPLDVVLSAFSHPLADGHHCASTLDSAARHYVLVMELVEHHGREIAPRMMRVRYEDLVDDREATVRAVLDFAGVPFDWRCLGVRLQDGSCYRYRNYLPQLRDVIPILQGAIDRLGYEV